LAYGEVCNRSCFFYCSITIFTRTSKKQKHKNTNTNTHSNTNTQNTKHTYKQALFRIPAGIDPIITLSFIKEPLCKWEVGSQLGSWSKFKNMPKVSSFFVQKLDLFMQRDMTLPNGISFHVPIKNERQLTLKLVRKYNDQNPTNPIVLPVITPQELALIPPPSAIPIHPKSSNKSQQTTSTKHQQTKTLDFSKDPDFKDVANPTNKPNSPEKSRGLRAAFAKRNQGAEQTQQPVNETQILLNVDYGKGQMLKSFFNLGDSIAQIKEQIAEKISIANSARAALRLLTPERELMDETKLLKDFKFKKMVTIDENVSN